MENIYNLITVIVILIVSTSITLLWRVCIYHRGGIFRPIGRILDLWMFEGQLKFAPLKLRILRFIAYPLGGCIYCSSFHFAYETFFLLRFIFDLSIGCKWLIVLLPLSHLFICIACKTIVHTNSDLVQDDVEYYKQINELYKSFNKFKHDEYIIWIKPKKRENKYRYCEKNNDSNFLTAP